MARMSLALVAGWITNVMALMSFINPPPSGPIRDLSNSETYTVGTTFNIVWTPPESGKGVSLVLWQLNSTTALWFGDMEYLTQGSVDATRYTWLVGSRKNLSQSNLFYFSIFQEGKVASDANSHYFYIADKKEQQVSATPTPSTFLSPTPSNLSSSSVAPTSPVSSAPISNSAPKSSVTDLSVPTTTPQPAQASARPDGFPLAAKIGIAIGIPAALAIGLGIGFLLFRRRKKMDATAKAESLEFAPFCATKEHTQYAYKPEGHFYGSNLNEAPPRSPVEIAPQRGQSYYPPNGLVHKTEGVPVRYEM